MLCCDISFSVRVVQLVVSVLISTMTSHAGLESCQSQTPCHKNVRSTRDTRLTLHGSGAKLRTPSCCNSELEACVKPGALESGEQPER